MARKVRCINASNIPGKNCDTYGLTYGKTYEFVSDYGDHYQIINDLGNPCNYYAVRFEEVVEDKWVEYTGYFSAGGFGSNWDKGVAYKVVAEDKDSYTTMDKHGEEVKMHKQNARIVPGPGQTSKKIFGFKLLKEYPVMSPYAKEGLVVTEWNSDGTVKKVVFTSKRDESYGTKHLLPEFWEPVYEPEKPTFEIVKLSNGINVCVSNGKIETDGSMFWDIKFLESLIKQDAKINGYEFQILKVKIGCQIFSRDDISKVINAYNKFQ